MRTRTRVLLCRRQSSLFSSASLATLSRKTNICLMGPPGSGKTTVSRLLADKLNMPVYDVDNDHLESVWKTTVAQKLESLGDEGFLDAEADATMQINRTNTIISLTGSNPLRPRTIEHLRKTGIVVFLDVAQDQIVDRCHKMKVDRIVGQATQSLDAILTKRSHIYNTSYDVRVIVEKGATQEQIAQAVLIQLQKDQRFVSTRASLVDPKPVVFSDVVRKGLAPDRGLYFPLFMPKFSLGQLERMVDMSYQERALRVLEGFPIGELNPGELRGMIYRAYASFQDPANPLPITHLEKNQFLMEQYHGPTASFKDLALQLTPHLFHHAIRASKQEKEQFLFVVATSGDTGSACLRGFGQFTNTPVVVLFPKHGVSPVQRAQMTSTAGDVLVLAVDGDFDFCQSTVKDIFNSPALAQVFAQKYGVHLTSGNSINWGRLWPQIPYSFHAYLDLVRQGRLGLGDPMDLCVPSGNFGNILGAVIAKSMGLPLRRLIAACNENKILFDFLSTGEFDRSSRTLCKTPSPSIDILLPSNLERYLYMLTRDPALINRLFSDLATKGKFQVEGTLKEQIKGVEAGWVSSTESIAAIKGCFQRTGVVIDPHTAVAKAVVDRMPSASSVPMMIASTAHFSKFPAAILQALDRGDGVERGTVAEIYQALKALPLERSAFHRDMEAVPNLPTVHRASVPASRDHIVHHITQFLQARQENPPIRKL